VVEIRALTPQDWPDVRRIYRDAIASGETTFETEPPPSWEAFDGSRLAEHRFVATEDGVVLGWATVSATSSRRCYAGVVENSVYVAADARGRGVGRALMEALLESTEAGGIWTVQAGMFPENESSVALHRKLGFRLVGRRERIARLDGVWRDTILLERRAP
jgi:phosphinothricin acetyltransferase